ncbi:MAG: helix-turn-helix transcriptional regulator [Lachnospiraceae bacterium]|nr:helix-turn-helix transcriptional regulator [Lachnospiraceae bacterium]
MEKNEIILHILAEYITNNPMCKEHLRAYHEAFIKYKKTNRTAAPEKLGISRSTLSKILKGDDSITVSSLKSFANALIESDCPLPDFRSELFKSCNACPVHRFLTKLLGLLYEEKWILSLLTGQS